MLSMNSRQDEEGDEDLETGPMDDRQDPAVRREIRWRYRQMIHATTNRKSPANTHRCARFRLQSGPGLLKIELGQVKF